MSNLILTRRAGQCVRLEILPGVYLTLMVACIGADQVKFELVGTDGSSLTRRVNVGDCLTVNEQTSIMVASINFRVVRLLFQAPLEVKIVRTELLERAS